MIGSRSAITTALPSTSAAMVTDTEVLSLMPVPSSISTRTRAMRCSAMKKKMVGGSTAANSSFTFSVSLLMVPSASCGTTDRCGRASSGAPWRALYTTLPSMSSSTKHDPGTRAEMLRDVRDTWLAYRAILMSSISENLHPQEMAYRAPDGASLVFHIYNAGAPPGSPVFLFLPAMGVEAKYYLPLVGSLAATCRAPVALADFRGQGENLRRNGPSEFGYREILESDLREIVARLSALHPDRPLYVVGHSI